jgi:hypothetical protein
MRLSAGVAQRAPGLFVAETDVVADLPLHVGELAAHVLDGVRSGGVQCRLATAVEAGANRHGGDLPEGGDEDVGTVGHEVFPCGFPPGGLSHGC